MLGAVTAYAVIAAGGLQIADVVVHALNLAPWTLRALVWTAAIGLPVTFVVSWFWDLTRQGFVRTVAPVDRPSPTPAQPTPSPARSPEAAAAVQAIGPGGVLAGRYRIERELGAGGMGRVLAAQDLKLGRRVAIKLVTGAHDPGRVHRFEQEARTAGSLEHPNVVAVYDLGEQEGVPFLVTELLDGQTLRSVIDSGPMPPEQVLGIALQLARGLGAAHASGIVHRDLKPENLFLTRDGRLKILDFGMAKLVSPEASGRGLTVTGVLFGTPGYVSPEQARGEKAGPPSDVFSAGAVLYELLSGKRAFPGNSLVEAGHAAITFDPPPLPEQVPSGLSGVIVRALQKDPARRYADGNALARDLERAGVEPAAVGKVGARRRMSTAAMALIAVLAIGAAVASAFFVHPRGTHPPAAETGPATAGNEPDTAEAPLVPTPPGAGAQGPSEVQLPAPPGATPAPPARGLGHIPTFQWPTSNTPGFDADKFAEEMSQVPMSGAVNGLMGGVNTLEALGQTDRAQRMLERYVAKRPDDLAGQLQLAAFRRRHGQRAQGDAELRKVAQSLQGNEWMKPLVRAWAGLVPEDDAITAAHVGGEPEVTRERLTQAYYYLGLKHETDPSPDLRAARRYFQKAAEEGGEEARLAGTELRKLRGSTGGEP